MVIRNMPIGEGEIGVSVFGISTLSRLDGPGKRMVVFFQGCKIGCSWCHSPHLQPECSPLLFHAERCLMCKRCILVCKNNVHRFDGEKHILDRKSCDICGNCIDSCPQSSRYSESGALSLPTKTLSVDNLFKQLKPHIDICGNITLSGGEALEQPEATLRLLELCKDHGINTALETSGLLNTDVYIKILPFVDVWLFGVRIVTTENIYSDFNRVSSNARLIASYPGTTVIPRIPVIPNAMDNLNVLDKIRDILNSIGVKNVWLNPWNHNYDIFYSASGTPLRFNVPTAEEAENSRNIIMEFFTTSGFSILNKN